MISLEQWRAAIGGWNSGNLSAIYRRYGNRRIVGKWAKLLLVMDSYTADIYYALYWLIVSFFAFMSSDGWIIALSLADDDTCGYPHDIRHALVESLTAAVFHVGHDNLQRFWLFASPTVAPLLRSCMIHLQRLWKLASPSVFSMLRLLHALKWLLIVAGDVELNPGPVLQELEKLLETTDSAVLMEDDLFSVYCEVIDLAPNWMDVALMLGLRHSYLKEIYTAYRERPRECLKEALAQWLKQAYNVDRNGLPTWKKMVQVTAHPVAGANPALAATLAQNHQGTAQTASSKLPQPKLSTDPSSTAVSLYAQYLRSRYQAQIPTFLTFEWPPRPKSHKIFNLAMIQGENIRIGPIDEEMVRLTLRGQVSDILYKKKPVQLKDILQMDNAKRKVILIEGAPGAGKSTLTWHVCQTWECGKLFQNFRSVVYIQLGDLTIQSAQSIEDIFPAENKDQVKMVMAEFRTCRGQDLLFVMDGWDELPSHLHKNSIFQQLIAFPETLNLHLSTVIITSRPIASSDLYRCISSRIEILGFTPTEVKDFFSEALGGESQAVQKLQDELKECPMVEASCYLPLNAAIVCHLYLAQNYKLPTTLHGVFTMLVLCCLKRHVVKQERQQENQNITSLDNLPVDIELLFKDVYTLAYHGVMDNRSTFPVEYLESRGLPKISETLGLIQGVESFTSLGSSPSYYFLHLSVQELLASFYISKLPEKEQVVVFNELFGKLRFAAVIRFYVAFTKLESEGIRTLVADIIQKKEKHQMLYLLHGLYEAQTLSLCQFVGRQLGGELDLTYTTLSPVDCLAIGYFISCICVTGSGEFRARLIGCSLDCYRVDYLTKELSKCFRSTSMQSTSMHKPKLAATDAGASSCMEFKLSLFGNLVGEGASLLCGWNVTLDLGDNGISDKGGIAIAESLKVNHSLTMLYLSGNGLSDESGIAIAESLKVNQSLTTLDLYNNGISAEGGIAIAECLKVNQNLTTLNLGFNQISAEGGRAIAESLKVNQCLTTLDLWGNGISDEGGIAIAESLKFNHGLTTLRLFNNGISAAGGIAFAESLMINQSLTNLDLSVNGISDDAVSAIAEALKVNQCLITLNLSGNEISDDAGSAIAEALNVNHSLKTLNLVDKAVSIIAEASKLNQSLTELHLYNTGISAEGGIAIAESLKVNQSLTSLDLDENHISDGVKAFAEALKVNQSLTELDLTDNCISDDGSRAIAEALRVNKSLAILILSYNRISDEGGRAITAALRVNKSLKTLRLWGNDDISSEMKRLLCEEFPGRVTFDFNVL